MRTKNLQSVLVAFGIVWSYYPVPQGILITWYITHQRSRRFVLDIHSYVCFSMPRFGTAVQSAMRPPAAARLRHARPTRHKVLWAKERAPTPTSTSGERRKESSPVPDMAGKKHGNLNTMQQHNLRMKALTYCCRTSCCTAVHTWWVVGSGAVGAASAVELLL